MIQRIGIFVSQVLVTNSAILLKNPHILYRFTIQSDFYKNGRLKI